MRTFAATIITYLLPVLVAAQVKLLEPGIGGGTTGEVDTSGAGLVNYLFAIFQNAIYIILALAVILFMIAGVMYIWPTTGSTQQGKDMFFRVVGGIILALTGYIILYAINPALVQFNTETLFPALGSSNVQQQKSTTLPQQPVSGASRGVPTESQQQTSGRPTVQTTLQPPVSGASRGVPSENQ